MPETFRYQVLARLATDWATYPERFQRLSPEAQAIFLSRQGYARLADLLAHIAFWWLHGKKMVEALLADPNFVIPPYDVDALNARIVAEVSGLDEAAVIASYEEDRRRMIDFVMGLPEAAFQDDRIIERLRLQIIGHYEDHAIE